MDTSPAPLVALPLGPVVPRLPVEEPFTAAMAARAGLGRGVLDRLHRSGRVRRLLRGVYVDATVPLSVAVRARALRLVVGEQVVVGTTAAWLHGVDLPRADPQAPAPIEVHGRSRHRYADRPVRYADRDLAVVAGVRCTTPLRTALDLGRQLAPDRALAALDGLLRLGAFGHAALLAELPRFGGQPGIVQLRELAAICDGRADGAAESVLRLRWLHGRLPTPSPGLVVRPGGTRLALGLEAHRFGALLTGGQGEPDLATLSALGWRIVVLGPDRVLRGDAALVTGHLEREFHLHLLDQVG
ncbi:type IV toxin-antitoxin system AbiEi family antitoxin domain-containing protein [Nocardioides pocheonensis]|uniref:AbiEi antitoxin N-terminal domain-containing protein n=1 Tax=Nocardioides pocheonensis TaxID=661485 RepID=A0A3N0GQX0_9ACTN|nr:type IV toxin-antitoxin system AbiEi family antitoxin domain-containing protein [Nocardioides pocheonensis]RNM14562.1 hypothetical protein EFL26_10775 [Nocardioides pocheonensis]